MNRRAMALLGLAAIAAMSCKKLATFHVRDEATTTVERGTLVEDLVGDFGFGEFLEMDVSQSAELQNQGVEPGDIEEVFLEAFELEATSPGGADLSFLDSLELYVEAEGLPRMRIAHQEDFPAGEPLVEMIIDEVDLTDYATSQAMSITTEVDGRRPDADTEVVARFDLSVGVTPSGACNLAKK